MNLILYIGVILFWGSSWFAIKFQLGLVPETLSISYRFYLASLVFFILCIIFKRKFNFKFKQIKWIALQGFFLFSLNYYFMYLGTNYVKTGLVAVIFSTVSIFVLFNGIIFFKEKINVNVLFGALIGFVGLILIFNKELQQYSLNNKIIIGIMLNLVGTYFASIGMLISQKNQRINIPLIQSNALSMFIGATFVLIISILNGNKISFDFEFKYISSLLYLSIIGSVLGFGFYLKLIKNIGVGKASYVNVVTPVLALIISTLYENYTWDFLNTFGLILVIFGNIIIFRKIYD
tara:strand:+ start:5074 stop:5946 length:873 start_codon:yes stop_codon:yes gene_type:complete